MDRDLFDQQLKNPLLLLKGDVLQSPGDLVAERGQPLAERIRTLFLLQSVLGLLDLKGQIRFLTADPGTALLQFRQLDRLGCIGIDQSAPLVDTALLRPLQLLQLLSGQIQTGS